MALPLSTSTGNLPTGFDNNSNGAGNAASATGVNQLPSNGTTIAQYPYNINLAGDVNFASAHNDADVLDSASSLDGFPTLKTIVDANTNVFRYALQPIDPTKVTDSTVITNSQYEDPTILGFTVEIDTENSPLFTQVLPFLQRYGVSNPELAARIPIYKDFIQQVQQIFKSQESATDFSSQNVYIKSHYINTITGMALLTKRFVKYMEDKLTLELYEDVTMTSTLLATLYNDLTYSYDSGRVLLPTNLTKFILRIKISEIRNLTSVIGFLSKNPTDNQSALDLKFNAASMVYTLYDCDFDFTSSQPVDDVLSVNGIATNVPKYSTLGLGIYFKSVTRLFRSYILGAIVDDATGGAIDDGNTTLTAQQLIPGFEGKADKKASSYLTYYFNLEGNPNNIQENANGIVNRQKMIYTMLESAPSKSPIQTTTDKSPLGTVSPKNALASLTNTVTRYATGVVQQAEQTLAAARATLLKTFVYDINKKLGIEAIVPDNVYTDMNPLSISNILGGLKSATGFNIEKSFLDGLTG